MQNNHTSKMILSPDEDAQVKFVAEVALVGGTRFFREITVNDAIDCEMIQQLVREIGEVGLCLDKERFGGDFGELDQPSGYISYWNGEHDVVTATWHNIAVISDVVLPLVVRMYVNPGGTAGADEGIAVDLPNHVAVLAMDAIFAALGR